MNIHFARDGEVLGQYPEDGVTQLVQARAIRGTDFFWHEGMSGWAPVSSRWPNAASPAPAGATMARPVVVPAIVLAR